MAHPHYPTAVGLPAARHFAGLVPLTLGQRVLTLALPLIGYTDFSHLAPAFVGLGLFAMGLGSYRALHPAAAPVAAEAPVRMAA